MVFLWISDKNTVIKTTERSFKYESSTCFCSGQTDPWVGSSQIGVLREKKNNLMQEVLNKRRDEEEKNK